jgi:hypothetical protein
VSTAALQRTIRRCTALVVILLALGFGDTPGFDGTLVVVGALSYLTVSGFLGFARLSDEETGGGQTNDPGDRDGGSGTSEGETPEDAADDREAPDESGAPDGETPA